MGLDEWLERLFGRFQKREELEVPTEWSHDLVPESIRRELDPGQMPTLKIEYVNKYRVPGLLLAKRFIALALMFFNIGLAVSTMIVGVFQNFLMVGFFWVNAYLLLDYLWKTRRNA